MRARTLVCATTRLTRPRLLPSQGETLDPARIARPALIEGLVDAVSRAVSERHNAPVGAELLERVRTAVELLVDGAIIPDAKAEAERRRRLPA